MCFLNAMNYAVGYNSYINTTGGYIGPSNSESICKIIKIDDGTKLISFLSTEKEHLNKDEACDCLMVVINDIVS